MALTNDAHRFIKDHLKAHEEELSLAIDATCGKGSDTEFLLSLGFNKVLAFDVQEKAVELTRQRMLTRAGENTAEVIHDGHENLENYMLVENKQRKAQCIMFNLGYLPTADKRLTTEAATTIIALNAALRNLSQNGIVSIMCYPGHPAGALEKQAVEKWLGQLKDEWRAELHEGVAPKPTAPILYLICNT